MRTPASRTFNNSKTCTSGVTETGGAAVPSAVPVLAVHDESVCEVDQHDAEACVTWLTAPLEAGGAAVLTDVPVIVETQIVANWSGTPFEPNRGDAREGGHQ